MRRQLLASLILFLSLLVHAQAASGPKLKKKPFPITVNTGDFPVPYEKYGDFQNVGTNKFKYRIKKRTLLKNAIGAGLFPGAPVDLKDDPGYKKWRAENPKVNAWDYVQSGDPQFDFYAWVSAQGMSPGNKLFFTAQALAEAGHIELAIKAYRAVIIHFYREPCWSADQSFVWYPAKVAASRIQYLTRANPSIGYRLVGVEVEIENADDTDLKNDVFKVNPGKWKRYDPTKVIQLSGLKIRQTIGKGKVQLVQYDNGHWQMRVKGKPMMVRGVTYNPTKVGGHPQDGHGLDWMHQDENDNGRPDGPYDSWVDKNENNIQDEGEIEQGDFALMQRMGVNAIRLYRSSPKTRYDPEEFNKDLLRDMHQQYGIYAIMGDFLGAYTVGSGASWEEGTDYTNEEQLNNMRRIIMDYVFDHRDEPYVLMWVLGNENLMPAGYSGVNATRTQAAEQVDAYLKFVNEMAQMIHILDPDHPVAVGNLDLAKVADHKKYAPNVDIFGANSYRGSMGFGDLFEQAKKKFDRPVLVLEYGCDAYNSRRDEPDEKAQANYHETAWQDIMINSAGRAGDGNAIGGVVFEYLDEWWKSNKDGWSKHSTQKDSAMAFPDGWANEEWFGVFGQGDGAHSPFLRQMRQAYIIYRDRLWKDDYKPY